MIKFFLDNRRIALLILPFFIVGYIVLNAYLNYFVIPNLVELDLGFWGMSTFPKFEGYPYLAGIFVYINAILLNNLFNINSFYEKNSYIISLLYVMLMSFYHSFYEIDGVIIAHLFSILSLYQLFSLESNTDGRKAVFNSGLLLGIAASFHPPLIFTAPIHWIMITRIRPFVFRETILATAGFITPLLYGLYSVFIRKNEVNWNFIETAVNYEQKQLIFLISLILFFVVSLLSVWGIRIKNKKSSIRFRKLTGIIYLKLLSGLILGTLEIIFLNQYEWYSFSVISLALFFPFSFINKSTNALASFFFYVIFTFSIAKFFI